MPRLNCTNWSSTLGVVVARPSRMSRVAVFGILVIAAVAIFNVNVLLGFYNGAETSAFEFEGHVAHMFQLKYHPWSQTDECREYFIEFIRNGSHPPMALTSYPGSGNTWVRGMIERLTGYFTGSVISIQFYCIYCIVNEIKP